MTQDYIGTKRVTAWPEDREGPSNEARMADGTVIATADIVRKPGYAVKYGDGYTSWSPKEAFEAAYQPVTAMSFGGALFALKAGHRVARAGWNGKGMWLMLVPGTDNARIREGTPYHAVGRLLEVTINPHIDMMTAQGTMQPGWLASQTDMLADDWMIVE